MEEEVTVFVVEALVMKGKIGLSVPFGLHNKDAWFALVLDVVIAVGVYDFLTLLIAEVRGIE